MEVLPDASEKAKPFPLPVSATVCIDPATSRLLSVTVRVPVRAPMAVGLKVILMVQLAPCSERRSKSCMAHAVHRAHTAHDGKVAAHAMAVSVQRRTRIAVVVTVTACAVLVTPTATCEVETGGGEPRHRRNAHAGQGNRLRAVGGVVGDGDDAGARTPSTGCEGNRDGAESRYGMVRSNWPSGTLNSAITAGGVIPGRVTLAMCKGEVPALVSVMACGRWGSPPVGYRSSGSWGSARPPGRCPSGQGDRLRSRARKERHR